ncbi:MAG: peptidyl-prolyl cis-trans isomerase [Balneolales bacterium]
MEKLRGGTKYTIWVLIISFGLLWVLADTQVFDAVMVGPSAMGEVKGHPISYQEFNERVNMYTEQYRERTGEAPGMEIRAMYEESVWDELVLNKVLQQKMDDIGLTVTDEELVEMVTGDNPAPFIRQQFEQEDGSIDRIALRNAIEAPENREVWMMVEQQLREQRRQEKLSKFLESSMMVSDYEIEREYMRLNTRADFRYILFPYSEVDESQIEVTDSELRSYYNNNKDRFQRNENWRISFVEFPKVPSPEDTLKTINELASLRDAFEAAENDSLFLRDHLSQTPFNSEFVDPSEVDLEHLPAFEIAVGEVSDPYLYNGQVHMIKKLDQQNADQTYTRARQIQLNFTEADRDQVEEQANYLIEQARDGESFQLLAQMYSQDAATVNNGGELGYFSRQDQSQPIADAAFQAEPGSIVGPIESENSLFILKIVDRTNQAIRFADLSQFVEADPMATIEALAREADDFSEFAQLDGFEEEAERGDYAINEAIATEGNPNIPGLGQSQLIISELRNMNRGEVSDVIETDESFVVLRVDQRTPEGIRPLDEVRSQVESAVRSQKREEVLVNQVNEKLSQYTSFGEIAEAEDKEIIEIDNIRKNAVSTPTLGREPKVVGTVFGLDSGEQSRAIQGENGVFVVFVEEIRNADIANLNDEEREEIRGYLNQQRNTDFSQIWAERLKADVEVKDYRHLRNVSR